MFIDLTVNNVYPTFRFSSDEIETYKARKGDLLISLENYLLDGRNILDADKIQKSIFPQHDIDVFISHSHADEDEAIRIALSLENIGLTAFVDSCVWGHADELLRKIDDKFCIPQGWSHYSYSLRNRTTTNVHLILNAALQQMIKRSELFMFLGTENAINIDDYMSGEGRLSSPWIFSELTFAKSVKRSERRTFQQGNESFEKMKSESRAPGPGFSYSLPKLKHELSLKEFNGWLDKGISVEAGFVGRISGLTHLDTLYYKLGFSEEQLSEPRFKI
ncbi:TPA: hypothetical protein ACRRC6_004610 [Klebsiella pneumoniae]|uniref:toll/interleukin-1 receptor domain-containing protein n=1 Tax=Enterobacteriaceae TaxID=543 RepID=UPI0007930DA8|nr:MULTISPECIES: toll/interleukin-1 receptor domain-containing protein [Enterobacter]HBQ1078698.1 toll/interleukin-1 receptor domain-containing protein [Klebsiella pneumoniae]MBX8914740.1 hypothetical protein [Enterobacter ludwigii]MCM7784663.1 toll/interleukin-1 receptor domain-containing protein [Enterobacter ludwigii]SAG59029.1 Uncharacterised protein [Enterobacter hormaechei]HBU9459335.1 toll/interleukin-1 receptor domain-containing protein [Klebsiella pneumoniae]